MAFLAFIGFLIGALVTYSKISDNWIAAIIGGFVLAAIVYNWYKQIIVIGLIIGAIFLFATS